MSQTAPPSSDVQSTGTSAIELPTAGTVPLGPDEPELFADAMGRILDHLGSDAFAAGDAGQTGATGPTGRPRRRPA